MKDSKNVSITRAESTTPEAVWEGRTVAPAVDVYENRDELLVVADFPGVLVDDIHINLNQDQLVLQGRMLASHDKHEVLSREFETISYRRAFMLPKGVEAAKITAEHTFGVLKVHLPKSEHLKPRNIPIKVV